MIESPSASQWGRICGHFLVDSPILVPRSTQLSRKWIYWWLFRTRSRLALHWPPQRGGAREGGEATERASEDPLSSGHLAAFLFAPLASVCMKCISNGLFSPLECYLWSGCLPKTIVRRSTNLIVLIWIRLRACPSASVRPSVHPLSWLSFARLHCQNIFRQVCCVRPPSSLHVPSSVRRRPE